MNTYEKIDIELVNIGKTRKEMCRDANISYNTIASLYQRKSENISLEILRKIARYLDVSLDYLIFDEITDRNFGANMFHLQDNNQMEYTPCEQQHIKKYRLLPQPGQETVDNLIDNLLGIMQPPKPLPASQDFKDLTPQEIADIKEFIKQTQQQEENAGRLIAKGGNNKTIYDEVDEKAVKKFMAEHKGN